MYQLIYWGYIDSRTVISGSSDETEITGLIAEAVSRRFDDPKTDQRFERYEIHDDPPLETPGKTGRRRKRADIKIRFSGSRPRGAYVFEAKRLSTKAHLGAYLGEDGIGRFISGTYAANLPDGGMIGYVQSSTPDAWQKMLFDEIKIKDGMDLLEDPTEISVFPELKNTLCSKHSRKNQGAIRIIHTLFDCT